jgi:uncharacterized protein (TIGR03086 family)
MDEAAALEQALASTARMVDGIGTDQWENSTPCSKWNVRQLVTHTVGVMANFAAGAANQPMAGDPDDFDLGDDPAATMVRVSAENVAAWKERGELESTVSLGDNEFPGMVGISINMLDAYVHGWDIAKATGQDISLDEEMCASLLGFSKQVIPEAPREGDNFHAVVATVDGAGSAAELLGYLGRRP